VNLAARIDRRSFFKITGTAAGGLLLSVSLGRNLLAAENDAAENVVFSPNAFLEIGSDDTVKIWSKNPEIGQGVKTAFPLIIAEELGADWSRVQVVQADFDMDRYGPQGAGGSWGIRGNWKQLREAGATARTLLVAAAAAEWGVEPSTCGSENGAVIHRPSGRRLSFGKLAAAAARLPVPQQVQLRELDEFKLLGQRHKAVERKEIITGAAQYGLDVRLPRMLYAAVAKPPVFGARVARIDDTAARSVPGVRHVVRIDPLDNPTHLWPGVAVIADSTWAALKGRNALKVEWNEGEGKTESTDRLQEQFRKLSGTPGKVLRANGDPAAALASAERVVSATYEIPFVAHAALEPVNCTADVREGRCDLWGPFQHPRSARTLAAQVTGLPETAVIIHMTRVGGGFGRRLMSDFAPEAALLSKAAGVPVQVVWTREDDMRHDFYRPAGHHRLEAGLDAQGKPVVWTHHLVNTSRYDFRQDSDPPDASELYVDDFPAGFIPNFRLEYIPVKTRIPTGPFRGTLHSANAFAVQCFVDELAHAAGKDPLALRLEMLGEPRELPYGQHGGPVFDTGRLRAVLKLAAEKAGWGSPLPAGRGRGIAGHFTFGSYAAHVVEVSVDEKGAVKVHRIVAAVDCGFPVNPAGIEAQLMGGTLDGLSVALLSEITVKDGRTVQGTFSDYPLLRFAEAPDVEVHIVPSRKDPSGMGEIALPPVAPALANAIFAATGRRIRRLPVRHQDLRPGASEAKA
jgi:isoquinoline 1-oxidoreductase beta subunit